VKIGTDVAKRYTFTLLLLLSGTFITSTTFAEQKPFATNQVVLTAKNSAALSSQLIGTIESLPVSEGEHFRKGDTLVNFDCTIHEAELKKTKALLTARQAEYRSNQRMAKANAISRVELAQSRADLAQAEADLTIKAHTANLCYIKAPFDGLLIKQYVHAHESVRQGQNLVEVLNNADLTIELIAPSQWLSWVKPGTSFQLYVEETQKSYPAHINSILPKVDAVSQSVRLLGKLDKVHKELIAGMSGRAIFNQTK